MTPRWWQSQDAITQTVRNRRFQLAVVIKNMTLHSLMWFCFVSRLSNPQFPSLPSSSSRLKSLATNNTTLVIRRPTLRSRTPSVNYYEIQIAKRDNEREKILFEERNRERERETEKKSDRERVIERERTR